MQGGMRDVLFIEAFVGEIEFLPKGGAVEGRFAVSGENTVGGLQDRGKVVHQGAGPVEDEVADQDKGLRGYGIKGVCWWESGEVKSQTEAGMTHLDQEW